jgi:hypothetical protein
MVSLIAQRDSRAWQRWTAGDTQSVSSIPVKASAAGARTGKSGGGVPGQQDGDGAGCRRVALSQATVQCAVLVLQVTDPEGRTEEPGTVRIAQA